MILTRTSRIELFSCPVGVRAPSLLIGFLILRDRVRLIPFDHSLIDLAGIGESVAASMGSSVVGVDIVKAMLCGRRSWRHLVKGEVAEKRCVRVGVHEDRDSDCRKNLCTGRAKQRSNGERKEPRARSESP